MSLPGIVESARPSVPGFDCNSVISATAASRFYNCGYKFCLRYVSIGSELPGDLSAQEAADILNAGLALMPVQHARKPGWSPDESLGAQDGQEAALNGQTIGFPNAVNLWLDLEGVNGGVPSQNVIDYCQAWHAAVTTAGYTPGIYVGASAILNGQQLYDLPFQHYWRSESSVPDIPIRSYQIIQLSPTVGANGISVDLDIAVNDKRGGQAQWLRMQIST